MEIDKVKKLLVNKESTIKETIRVIDQGTLGIALVVDESNKLFGTVTDGDIRTAILNGVSTAETIETVTNKNPIVSRGGKYVKLNGDIVHSKDIYIATPQGGSLKVPKIKDEREIEEIIFAYTGGGHGLRFRQKPESNDKKIKKVLIIGGAGFLGSVLCRQLLNRDYKVRVLDNLTYGNEGIKDLEQNENFEFLKGDIRNISDVVKAVKGIDAVIHLAAIVGDPASSLNTEKTIEINLLSAKMIAEVCKFNQVNKFLFASSCSLYGASQNPGELLKEYFPLNPVSLYARTKYASEEGIVGLTDENFSPTIFRFATLYGLSPRMRFDLVVNLLTAKALQDKKITIFGGNQWRPNLDVSDAALACLKWVESPIEKSGGEIFNVGANSQNHKIIEIGEIIKKHMPETEIEIKKEEGDIRNYNVSFDKILNVIDFNPEKTIEKAVLEMKAFIETEKIKDFNNPKYSNYRFLSERIPIFK